MQNNGYGLKSWGAHYVYFPPNFQKILLPDFLSMFGIKIQKSAKISSFQPLNWVLGLGGQNNTLKIWRIGGTPPKFTKKSVSKMAQNGLKRILNRSLKSWKIKKFYPPRPLSWNISTFRVFFFWKLPLWSTIYNDSNM